MDPSNALFHQFMDLAARSAYRMKRRIPWLNTAMQWESDLAVTPRWKLSCGHASFKLNTRRGCSGDTDGGHSYRASPVRQYHFQTHFGWTNNSICEVSCGLVSRS